MRYEETPLPALRPFAEPVAYLVDVFEFVKKPTEAPAKTGGITK
jgi:hypothetical protein